MSDSAKPELENQQVKRAHASATSNDEPEWTRKAQTIEARATWYLFRSRRGLLNRFYAVRCCPKCSEAHQFRTAGLRVAPCGARLVIKARKARSR